MGLIDRIMKKKLLKTIICYELTILAMATIYINTNNAWGLFK